MTYEPNNLNGPPTTNAMRLAVEEVNDAGGITVGGEKRRVDVRTVVINEESREEAVAATERLLNQEDVCAIIGPQNSDEAIPAAALADRAGVPLISPLCSHALMTRGRTCAFRICYRDDVQGKALAVFARETLKARTAALLVESTVAYSRTVAEQFQEEFSALGGRIVADESFVDPKGDLGRQLSRLRKAAADVLLLPDYADDSRIVGIAARRAGVKSTLLGSDSWNRRAVRVVPEFDGSYMTTNWSTQLDTAANRAFMHTYGQRFSAEPTETAALTYDAARVLFAAIAAADSAAPAAIRDALHALPAFEGVSGTIRFGSGGDPDKSVIVLSIKNGRDSIVRVIAAKPSQ